MTRLAGAILVVAAGLLAGLDAVNGRRKRLQTREELVRMLELMEFELGRFSAPLPAMFERLAGQLPGDAGALCRRMRDGLAALGEQTLGELWARALDDLPPAERRMLLPLGQVLGRYGAREQLMALAACRETVARARDEARAELREKGRVTVGVAVAGAAVLAVLLM